MWIIQLRSPEAGSRYFTRRGKGVTTFRDKAKVFSKQDEALYWLRYCTLWPDRLLIKIDE